MSMAITAMCPKGDIAAVQPVSGKYPDFSGQTVKILVGSVQEDSNICGQSEPCSACRKLPVSSHLKMPVTNPIQNMVTWFTVQTSSWSVQPFLHSSPMFTKHRHRHTHHTTYDIHSNAGLAMQLKMLICKYLKF